MCNSFLDKRKFNNMMTTLFERYLTGSSIISDRTKMGVSWCPSTFLERLSMHSVCKTTVLR
jgi:hypothetical protein